MTLKFYNTLTRSLEEFKPVKQGEVSLYCCGPTVYNYIHIGNLRAMAFYDLVRRYLKFKGYEVKHVMNITDVEDKIIRTIAEQGRSLKEFTEYYTDAFLDDLKALRIEIAETLPRATDEIEEMVSLIQTLLDKGYAYKTDKGDIYFKISAFEDYGQLANLDRERLVKNAAGRLSNADEYDKEDADDFALWKAWDEKDGQVFWETSIGKGRPGWHIECSAMATRYLGQPIDIHCGGVDLIFPHHTNEIAQTECASGKKFVNYWMHNAHLIVDGKKMSKSLGNFYTLRELLDKGCDPLAIRFELIKTHYRQTLDFSLENFSTNQKLLRRFFDFQEQLKEGGSGSGVAEVDEICKQALGAFEEAMDSDLNISSGLAAIYEFMNKIRSSIDDLSAQNVEQVLQTMQRFDMVLGIIAPPKGEDSDPEIDALVEERNAARAAKDFARADQIRDELKARGIELKDAGGGKTTWYRV